MFFVMVVCDFFGPDTPIMLLAILVYIVINSNTEVEAKCTNCVRGFNGNCFEYSFVTRLAANFRTGVVIRKMEFLNNRMYYSYEPAFEDPQYYKIDFVEFGVMETQQPVYEVKANLEEDKLKPLHNFGTFAIDPVKSKLYLGGVDGIFVYSPSKLTPINSDSEGISTLFFKDKLYAVKVDEPKKIVVLENDTFQTVLENKTIKNFLVTKDDVIVYLETFGLFLNKGAETVQLSGNAFFRGFTADKNGVVYTWWIDEIYKINIKETLSESRLIRLPYRLYPGALTFDGENNMLYTDGPTLKKIVPVNSTKCLGL